MGEVSWRDGEGGVCTACCRQVGGRWLGLTKVDRMGSCKNGV